MKINTLDKSYLKEFPKIGKTQFLFWKKGRVSAYLPAKNNC